MKLPDTIRSIYSYLRPGLGGALVWVGASNKTHKCPEQDGECRPSYKSFVQPDGTPEFEVGLQFSVNGKRGENWTMLVAYEPIDVFTVYLWREANAEERARGLRSVVLAKANEVYFDTLASVVESMYDQAIEEYCEGMICLS